MGGKTGLRTQDPQEMNATKTVRAARVKAGTPVEVALDTDCSDALSTAARYLLELPGRVREVQQAAKDLRA